MFFIKESKVKKGYILPFTIILGTIILTLAIYNYKMTLNEIRNIKSMEAYLKRGDLEIEYKENLLTELEDFIQKTIIPVNNDKVKNYFISNLNFKLEYKNSYISFDRTNNCFILFSNHSLGWLKGDEYNYEVVNNKVKLKYLKSIYREGSINK